MDSSVYERENAFTATWLDRLPLASRVELRRACKLISLTDRKTIYTQGGEQKWLWGIDRGQVRVLVRMNEMEPTLGHVHQVGAWFGESELLQNLPGLVEMQAAGEVTVARIAFSRFQELGRTHPALWEGLALLTSMNQTLAMAAANDLALRTGRMRLAATLLRLSGHRADFQQTSTSPTIPANQQEIANLANVSLSKASEDLTAFAADGLIGLEYGRIAVLDEEGLKDLIQP